MSRIAIVVHAVYPGDTRVRRQADALIDAGHEVDVLSLRRPGEPPRSDRPGERTLRLPLDRTFTGFAGHMAEYLAFAGMAAVRLAREHRARRYALVQIAGPPDFLAFAAAPVKLAGVPLLLDLHEDMPEFFRDRFTRPLLRPLLPAVTAATRAAAGFADALITVHEPLRRLSLERGVPADKIEVVMNSADTRLFDPARHTRRPFMEDGVLRLVHHSNLQRLYGIDVAIEAIALLGPAVPVHLDIYGEGPFRPDVEAAIARTGTGDRVTMHGWARLEDIPGLLAGADIGLVPSRDEPYLRFSLSQKLLEYAAMGLPIIATELDTFRAHFTSEAVRYVPGGEPPALASAISQLASDPAGAREMGAAAQRQAAAYAWPLQRQRYVELVERLMTRR
ncbi:MAG TPA: glycosyltransferase [Candidatus Limnocylindria bacterium]|nr:glycosyltransferase [Candidatus Limnocylindria bacterium]